MTTTTGDRTLTAPPTRDLVDAVSHAFDEPAWLRDHRIRALAYHDSMRWPSGLEDEWRRTALASIPLEAYTLDLATGGPAPTAVLDLAGPERGALVVHQNGGVERAEILDALAAQGVLVLPLAQAAHEHGRLLREHLNSAVPLNYDRFAALSAALWTQGLFVYLPRNVQVERTLVHLLTKRPTPQGLFGHTLIVAEEGSSATVVEAAWSETGPAPSFVSRSVEIVAGPGSQVRYAELQRWGMDVSAVGTTRARLGRDAQVLLASAAFGSRLAKLRLEIDAIGDGSNADLVCLFVGREEQQLEYITRQVHTGIGTRSELTVKGALDDNAHAVQRGVVHILPGAQKTSAHQVMRNLLLSTGAGADPIPILEIEADDVKCSHAAAVGPVNPEHLFYMQARGIPADEAERLVVQGFLQVVTDRLPDAHLRETVHGLVDAQLRLAGESV